MHFMSQIRKLHDKQQHRFGISGFFTVPAKRNESTLQFQFSMNPLYAPFHAIEWDNHKINSYPNI